MAFSAGICCEVRTGGSDSNGGAFGGGSALAAPSAPTVDTATTGGSVAANTYYVVITKADEYGETSKSPQTSITTTGASSTITVTAPAIDGTFGSWSAYMGTTSNGPWFVQNTGLVPGTNYIRTTTPATTGTQPPGTNYSQQNSPQISYTDIVIGTPNTTATSAANSFTPDMVRNVWNVTAGTGFTVQRVEMTGCTAAGVATFDKALGTIGSTGGTAALGGALATLGMAGSIVTGVVSTGIWVAPGNYDMSNTSNVAGGRVNYGSGSSGGAGRWTYVRGYDVVRGDATGTMPVLRPSVNSSTMFNLVSSTSNFRFMNLEVQKNGFTGTRVLAFSGGSNSRILGCKFNTDDVLQWSTHSGGVFEGNDVTGWIGGSPLDIGTADGFSVVGNRFHGGSGTVFSFPGQVDGGVIEHNLFYDLTGAAPLLSHTAEWYGTFRFNIIDARGMTMTGSIDLLRCLSRTRVENNVLAYSSTTRYAVGPLGGSEDRYQTVIARNNAFFNAGGSTILHPLTNTLTSVDNVTLTGDPFTNAAGGDFSLNNTAGAGAACKGIAYPQSYPGLSTPTNHADAGAYQSQASASGGGGLVGPSALVTPGGLL